MHAHIKLTVALASAALVAGVAVASSADKWNDDEIGELRGMWIGSLEKLPTDPTNRVADDPRAAALGQRFFFDTRLSANGRVSCATCHIPERDFQDGTPLAKGVGTTHRRTMPIASTARAPFLFWDGRKDSQWSQALGPLESPVEHGGTRGQYARFVAKAYRAEYESLFGALPDMSKASRDDITRVFANIGKSIAAYERKIDFGPSRFDRYVEGLVKTGSAPSGILSEDEVAGLRLFIGKANCTQCHNGPLLTNNEFHNTGIPAAPGLPEDHGRADGAKAVLADEFNCRSKWSDAIASDCAELEFLAVGAHEQERAFKVPSLRNVADRAPYMHAGQIATLADVVAHYNRAPKAPSGHTELKPLKLNARELRQLEAYLHALSGPVITPE